MSGHWEKQRKKLNYIACLVARGFKQTHKGNIKRNSSTCFKESSRLIISVMFSNEWSVESLCSHKSLPFCKICQYIGVFLEPLREADTKKLWKLLITVYELCDDPNAWYLIIKKIIHKVGASKCKFDDALVYWHTSDKLEGIMCCHNFVWGESFNFKHFGLVYKNLKLSCTYVFTMNKKTRP